MVSDWSKVVELPSSRRSDFTIRTEAIGVAGLPLDVKISYRLLPGTCSTGPVDSTKLYALTVKNGETKFNHISNWDSYIDLGYSEQSTDIVNISYDLFLYFGEGEEINSSNVSVWISGASSFAGEHTELEFPELEPNDETCEDPQASFTASPMATTPGNYLDFTNASSDPAGKELSYHWDFDNGVTSSLENISRVYQEIGNYYPSLQATNTCGASDSTSKMIKICDPNQVPDFITNKTEALVGEEIDFDNISSDPFGHILSYTWTFGDGASSTEACTTHSYSEAGTYEAKLGLENVCGRISYKVLDITVRAPDPEASYEFESSFLSRDMQKDEQTNYIIPFQPSVPTTVFFKSHDPKIFAGMTLNNISQRVTVTWDVYDANSNYVGTMTVLLGSNEEIMVQDTNFDFLSFGTNTNYGTWRAEAKIDGVYQFTENFKFLEKFSAPTNLSIESVTGTTVKINWQAEVYADAYKIERQEGGVWIDKGTVTNLYFQDSGLSAGTDYIYRVYSTNKGHISLEYVEFVATTESAPEPTPTPEPGIVEAPTNLRIAE